MENFNKTTNVTETLKPKKKKKEEEEEEFYEKNVR